MNTEKTKKKKSSKSLLIKKCHVCGTVTESNKELKRCDSCRKAFLPANYFGKVHVKNSKDYGELFLSSDELCEEDLIKGISVLW